MSIADSRGGSWNLWLGTWQVVQVRPLWFTPGIPSVNRTALIAVLSLPTETVACSGSGAGLDSLLELANANVKRSAAAWSQMAVGVKLFTMSGIAFFLWLPIPPDRARPDGDIVLPGSTVLPASHAISPDKSLQ